MNKPERVIRREYFCERALQGEIGVLGTTRFDILARGDLAKKKASQNGAC